MTAPEALQEYYDVVVIGGGLAGSAAAAVLVRAGVDVCVLERDAFPRDKLCGEFLSGESARLLRELGCLDQILAFAPARMDWMRFIGASGAGVKMDLPAPAFGISRRVLDDVLLKNAAAAGAAVVTQAEVRELRQVHDAVEVESLMQAGERMQMKVIRAGLVIGSYGRRSHLDKALQRPFVASRSRYVGFKRHHKFASGCEGEVAQEALLGGGEMYLLRNGYCGICPVEGAQANVCMLIDQSEISKAGGADWDNLISYLCKTNGNLAARLKGLEAPPDEAVLSVAQVPFQTKESYNGRIMFAGDAAGMIAPLCGDGQAMALESGVKLAGLVLQFKDDVSQLQGQWSAAWSRMFGMRMKLGRALQPLIMQPPAAQAGLAVLARSAGLRKFLAGATRGR